MNQPESDSLTQQGDPTKDRIAVIHEDTEATVEERLASAKKSCEEEEEEEQGEEDLVIEEEKSD
jgi:hypothetical protein